MSTTNAIGLITHGCSLYGVDKRGEMFAVNPQTGEAVSLSNGGDFVVCYTAPDGKYYLWNVVCGKFTRGDYGKDHARRFTFLDACAAMRGLSGLYDTLQMEKI